MKETECVCYRYIRTHVCEMNWIMNLYDIFCNSIGVMRLAISWTTGVKWRECKVYQLPACSAKVRVRGVVSPYIPTSLHVMFA